MIPNNITYKLYTISDLTNWLLHNVDNGLSEIIISKKRAFALINNPHANVNDVVLSVVFDSNRVIGYTAVFPEKFIKPVLMERYYWGTTQWLEPEYRGKGISAKMMLNIKVAVNNRYLGLDSSVASTKLDKKQGSVITYYPRYFILIKANTPNIKGKLKEHYVRIVNKNVIKKLETYQYINEYVCHIDDMIYDFISKNSKNDIFLRSQEILNWQLQYPFLQCVGFDAHLKHEECQFGTNVHSSSVVAIKVIKDYRMIGFYILNVVDGNCIVRYLYYLPEFKNEVFASVLEKSFSTCPTKISTVNKVFYEFMIALGIKSMNSNSYSENISLTTPSDFIVDENMNIQGGDGDLCF